MRRGFRIGSLAAAVVLTAVGLARAAPPTQSVAPDPDAGADPYPMSASGDEHGPSGKSNRHPALPPAAPGAGSTAANASPAFAVAVADFPFRYLGMFSTGEEAPRPILVRGSRWLLASPGQVLDGIARVETVSPDGLQVYFLASRDRRFISFAQITVRSEQTSTASPAGAAGNARAVPDHPYGVRAADAASGDSARNSGMEALRALMGMEDPNPEDSIETLMGLQNAPPSPETGSAGAVHAP